MVVMADSPPGASSREHSRAGRANAPVADAFARGDRASFAELISAQQAPVARLVHRLMGWGEDVDDVVQEVFLAAWKNLHRFRGDSSLATWLTRVALNECRSHRRGRLLRLRAFRRSARDAEAAAAPTGRARPDSETSERVRQAVRELPGRYRRWSCCATWKRCPSARWPRR